MVKILEGLRIVEGSAFVAAPLAGMTLAQMGADVIRFDRIRGGPVKGESRGARSSPALQGEDCQTRHQPNPNDAFISRSSPDSTADLRDA